MEQQVWLISEERLRRVFKEILNEHRSDQLNQHSLPELLTRSQAANALGCSPITIDNYARKGILERVILGNRRVRFRKDQILKISKLSQSKE